LRAKAEFAILDDSGERTDDITAQIKIRNLNVMMQEQTGRHMYKGHGLYEGKWNHEINTRQQTAQKKMIRTRRDGYTVGESAFLKLWYTQTHIK
jgi:hypothetical protein